MAESAAYLISKRQEALTYLQNPCTQKVLQLSKQQESFFLSYEPSLKLQDQPTASLYEEQWRNSRKKDLEYGTTLLGPHKDDILFFLDCKEVKIYCSEGQKRCCLAALRLSEWERMNALLQAPPLFGIDDFAIHLDETRSFLLQNLLRSMGQVFITAPSLSHIENSHQLRRSVKNKFTRDIGNTLVLKESF